jgi:hypothetical protein
MESLTFVGGIIIFFSVVLAVLRTIGLPSGSLLGETASGLVEVTSGARGLSALPATSPTLAAAAFVIAFGGFAVHAQSFHFLSGTGIRTRDYLLAKLLHGVVAAGITVCVAAFLT